MPNPALARFVFDGTSTPLLALSGVEAISQPFQFTITVPSSPLFDTRQMAGRTAGLRLQDAQGSSRDIRGLIFSVSETPSEISITLMPRLAAGQQAHNTRLFLGKTRQTIVSQVLQELGYAPEQIIWLGQPSEKHLSASLVQADESQLAFIQRLLAELQCLYWFDSDDELEKICIGTELGQAPMCPELISLSEAKKAALNGEARPMKAFFKQPKPGQRLHQPEQAAQRARGLDVFLPLPDGGAELATRQSVAHRQAVARGWTLTGNYPILASGFGVEPPSYWRTDQQSEPLAVLHCHHSGDVYDSARPELGLKYQITATLIPRSSGYRPDFPAMPELPMAFPATIESRHAFADLDAQGRYQFRFAFSERNTEKLEHTHASPPTARLVPFANAHQPLSTGWHFPLLDQSTVLVALLDNDPNQPCILGFAPSAGQEGPVTAENAAQSRIVTPGQNELTFDDELPNVVLQTFDGQNRVELNAHGEHQFIYLGAQYGVLQLTAGQYQRWLAEENLVQKHGGHYLETIKQQATADTSGSRHMQAGNRQQLRAAQSLSQQADNHLKMQARQGKLQVRSAGPVTIKSGGAHVTKVANGSYNVQASGHIELRGTGQGNLTVSNGTGGFKIDPQGNIKVFGEQVTLKGQSGVTFNGDVEYELGASNAPESTPAVEPVEIEDIEPLALENTEASGEARQYERDANLYDAQATEQLSIEIKDSQGNTQPNTWVEITKASGDVVTTRSDRYGMIYIQKAGFNNAKIRLKGYKAEKHQ